MFKNIFTIQIKSIALGCCIFLSFLLTGCGPSEEKIAQAQETYRQLIDIHNQVVEAHKNISDDSLDKELSALANEIRQVEQYHLNEMKDEEIDQLIASMNSHITSYRDYLDNIKKMKTQEDAAVLTTIHASLHNDTSLTFRKLSLYSKNASSPQADLLENTAGLVPGQYLTGLIIYRDVSATPWILALEDAEGTAYEIELSVEKYGTDGVSLSLTYDSETGELECVSQ